MATDNGELDGAEIVMLIEALDAWLPFPEDAHDWADMRAQDRERWAPYDELSARLKQSIQMSFYDHADLAWGRSYYEPSGTCRTGQQAIHGSKSAMESCNPVASFADQLVSTVHRLTR